jgi:hypothetical protein
MPHVKDSKLFWSANSKNVLKASADAKRRKSPVKQSISGFIKGSSDSSGLISYPQPPFPE